MPDEAKKNHDKKKGDPKEQRKPRQRQQQSVKKTEPKAEQPKGAPKVIVPQKPVYEEPPPEFYKNLKRETDEILKITEEENTKYKKKEIQSNWSKYELPIDSYEEIEEHENMGADYEKLIQAPLSIGGHFQFKHEKSWDTNIGPSLYDKYFEINMEDLNIALSTIPFYERNSINQETFSQTDITTMDNRATRFKQKYFKSFSTPETEALDKILNTTLGLLKDDDDTKVKETTNNVEIKSNDVTIESTTHLETEVNLEFKTVAPKTEFTNDSIKLTEDICTSQTESIKETKTAEVSKCNMEDDFVFGITESDKLKEDLVVEKVQPPNSVVNLASDPPKPKAVVEEVSSKTTPAPTKVADAPVETKNPVIESPEDLEKWLDDFLDG